MFEFEWNVYSIRFDFSTFFLLLFAFVQILIETQSSWNAVVEGTVLLPRKLRSSISFVQSIFLFLSMPKSLALQWIEEEEKNIKKNRLYFNIIFQSPDRFKVNKSDEEGNHCSAIGPFWIQPGRGDNRLP